MTIQKDEYNETNNDNSQTKIEELALENNSKVEEEILLDDKSAMVLTDDNKVNNTVTEEKQIDKKASSIGLTDIFDMKYNQTPSNVVDVNTVEPNYDVFSFFEDAAPYER